MTTLRERAKKTIDIANGLKSPSSVVVLYLREMLDDIENQFREAIEEALMQDRKARSEMDAENSKYVSAPTAADALKAVRDLAYLVRGSILESSLEGFVDGCTNLIAGRRDTKIAKAIIGDEPKIYSKTGG